MKLKNILNIIFITFTMFFVNIIVVNAASAHISVYSSASRVVVGNTFTVTVTVSSSEALGSWEYVIDYDSSVVKYVSGSYSVADFGNGSQTSASYSYTFKAIASGNGYIGVKSYNGYAWSEEKFSMSAGSTSVKVISQEELEASYSKDNNLSSLSVNGSTISPEFNPDIIEYIAKVDSNTEKVVINATTNDSRATLTGTGEFEVSEGENKFELIVTAENGGKKTYLLTVIVEDPNPINVETIDGKKLTIVKRASSLKKPNTFSEKTIKINDLEIPAFYSEIMKITLVGLKDQKGEIYLYSYDNKNNTYTLYQEMNFNTVTIYPLDLKEDAKFNNYLIKEIKINDIKVKAYKTKEKSNYSIFYGINVENNETGYFMYDEINNSVVKYSSDEVDKLNDKLLNYEKIIIILLGESVILLMIIFYIALNRKKKIKRLLNELKNRNELKINNLEETKEKEIKNNEDIKLTKLDENEKDDNEVTNKQKKKEKRKSLNAQLKDL
ncbi:MAG: cadherin-like beta sandwich domain-containing protein [Bacilli bacterium]|nr:cadherin-like beta sandwich domain-containing protein [Bacilli bacterium]